MKNILLHISVFLLVAIAVCSCAASKEGRVMKKKINGEWLLKTITTEGINGKVTAKLFNEAPFNCFVGSYWSFVRNGNGTYIFNQNGTECNAITRPIRWSIYEPKGEEKRLQFKRLGNDNKDLDNGEGFRMNIVRLTDSSMQLKSPVSFEGNQAAYLYNFVKRTN